MSKKLWTASAILLLSFSLIACSSASKTVEPSKTDTVKMTEAPKEDKTTSKWKHLKESTVTYPTEEDIDAMKTVGDIKKHPNR